jgi:carboxymethylenebutenolidase
MPVATEWVRFGEHLGYLARPGGVTTALPGVVVIQEIWGVDAHIEDVTERLAAAGYAALAPDLFAVGGHRPETLERARVQEVQAFVNTLPPGGWMDPAIRGAALAPRLEADRLRIESSCAAMLGNLGKMDRFLPALRASVRHLREAAPNQKVACVGFCMGGGLSALLACEEPELGGTAMFYGSAPSAERLASIACPVIGFYGAGDMRINAGLPAFSEAMRTAGKRFESHVYEGAGHAFFNDTRPSYHVGATRDSFSRLLEFLRTTIGT